MSLRRLSSIPASAGAYTPVGAKDKRVDFWDQPRDPKSDGNKPAPTPFVDGVWASVTALRSPALAKQLPEQIVTISTHLVVINFMEGLTSRMFIVFDGRRFDIDSINDPDERKVELQILCVERNDGK